MGKNYCFYTEFHSLFITVPLETKVSVLYLMVNLYWPVSALYLRETSLQKTSLFYVTHGYILRAPVYPMYLMFADKIFPCKSLFHSHTTRLVFSLSLRHTNSKVPFCLTRSISEWYHWIAPWDRTWTALCFEILDFAFEILKRILSSESLHAKMPPIFSFFGRRLVYVESFLPIHLHTFIGWKNQPKCCATHIPHLCGTQKMYSSRIFWRQVHWTNGGLLTLNQSVE
jgi:hypothetical protein